MSTHADDAAGRAGDRIARIDVIGDPEHLGLPDIQILPA